MFYIDYNPNLLAYARRNRQLPTLAEKIMWKSILKDSNIRYKFLRQKPILNFILDFYCSKLLLAIEVDGDSHEFQRKYDVVRTSEMNKLGIKIIRYTNEEVIYNTDNVFDHLINEIKKRKTELKKG